MSPARNVTVNIVGDASGFSKSMSQAATDSESAGGRLGKAFSSAFGQIQSATGGALGPIGEIMDAAQQGLDHFSESGHKASAAVGAVGLASAAAGTGLALLGSKDKEAQQQLATAISNTGHSYDDYKDKIEGAVRSMTKFGYTGEQTQNGLQNLVQATHDPQKALDDLGVAADLAAAKHESLTTATSQLAQIIEGKGTKTLATLGINLHDVAGGGKDANANIAAVAQVVQGQASAASDSYSGKLRTLKADVENAAASFGSKYGPALTAVGAGVSTITTLMGGLSGAVGAVTTATEAEATADEALVGPEMAALGPVLLIIAAIAILGIGIYELVTHWSAAWGAMKAAVNDAWHFIDSTFIQPIQTAIAAVVDFIKAHWQLLLAILTGPIGIAVLEIKNHFQDILTFVSGIPGDIENFFSGIGSFFAGVGQDIVNGIVSGVENMGSAIWDAIKSHIPGSGLIGSALNAIGLAEGGVVTKPTLAVVGEAGPEAVVPLKSGVSMMGLNDTVSALTGLGGSTSALTPSASGGGNVTIQVPLYIDGKAVGQATASYVRDSLIRGQKNYSGSVLR